MWREILNKDSTAYGRFEGENNLYFSSPYYNSAGSKVEARNLVIEGLICDDPCLGKDHCQTFVDSCQKQPRRDTLLGNFAIPVDYIISFEVKLSTCSVSSDSWRSVVEFGDGKITFNAFRLSKIIQDFIAALLSKAESLFWFLNKMATCSSRTDEKNLYIISISL